MKRFLLILTMILWASSAQAATWYVDSAVGTSGTGTSWAAAWKNFSNIKGLQPGDVVNISGGTVSKTYNTGEFLSASGTAAAPITYQVSAEAGHNGMVNIVVPSQAPWHWIYASPSQRIGQWIIINGNVGGVSHMTVTAPIILDAVSSQGIVLRYITTNGQVTAYDADSIELDHVTFTLNNGIDGVIRGIGRNQGSVAYPSGYTRNSIHDCVLNIATDISGNGFGDDGIQNVGNISLYNNRIIGVNVNPYSGSQHQDGIQTKGPNVRIYNNYFENITNYPIFGEFFSNGGHFQIFNNILYKNPSQNISLGSSSSGLTIDDIQIFNNTIVNGGIGIALGQGYPNTTVTNSNVVNNLIYNTPTPTYIIGGPTVSNNTTGGTAGISFVSPTGDFHLQGASTAAIDKGISPSNITSITKSDREGNTRPAGTAWDIGAYEFGGIADTAPPPPQNLKVN